MRGVNKLVVEIKSDGEYIEKALLFLKPEKQNAPQKEISDGAQKLLSKIKTEKNTEKSIKNILVAIISSLTGSLITFLTIVILGLL